MLFAKQYLWRQVVRSAQYPVLSCQYLFSRASQYRLGSAVRQVRQTGRHWSLARNTNKQKMDHFHVHVHVCKRTMYMYMYMYMTSIHDCIEGCHVLLMCHTMKTGRLRCEIGVCRAVGASSQLDVELHSGML